MSNKYEHEMQRRDCWIQVYSAYISSNTTAYMYPAAAGKHADEALTEFDKRFKVQEESRPPHIPTLEEAHGAH